MATYFLNSEWAALTAGTVVEVTGGTAVIGTDAFASVENLTIAAGDTVAYEGGTFDSIYSAEGVTTQINENIVYTGNSIELSGITVNADTIDTAKAAITAASDVNYGMVTVLGGTNAGGYVVDGDLYVKNNVYYNDSTFTEATTTVDVGGATFSGTYGTNIFAKTEVADLNALTGAGKTTIFSGDYDTVKWGKADFNPSSNVMIFEGGTVARSASSEGRFWLFRGAPAGDLYGAMRNVRVDNIAYFYMFYGTNTAAAVTIDFDNVDIKSGLRIVRANATVGNLTMNVINSSFDASVTDDAKLVVNGDFCFNVVNSTMTGNINLLSSSAGTTAKNLFFSLTNSTVGELVAHTNGIIAEGGVAALIVKGANTAANISAFDTITIYADGGEKASLTAESIDFNGTITVDLSNVTKSGTFKVIDITGDVANNWNVEFVNAGYSGATYETVENDLVISVDYVAVDTDSVYVNSNWTAADANDKGLIALANGNQAVWGVNAFASVGEAMAAANGKPIVIDGGVYDEAIGLTELVITGDVTITDWTGVTSVIVKNGATITTDKWSSAITLTIEAAGNDFSTIINYTGNGSVDYGDVTVTGDDAVKSIVLGNKLYVGSDIVYNDTSLAGTAADAVVTFTINGETFSGVYGKNVFSFNGATVSDLNTAFSADRITVLSGSYDISAWASTGYSPKSNAVIYDGATFTGTAGGGRFSLVREIKSGDVYGAIRNTTGEDKFKTHFYLLHGVVTTGNAVIDLDGLKAGQTIKIVRGSTTVNDFTLNVSGSTIGTIYDLAALTVTGNMDLNIADSRVNGINVLSLDTSSIAGDFNTTLDNVYVGAFTSKNVFVGEDLNGGNGKVTGNTALIIKNAVSTGAISGFDTITIYADGEANANLTATSIDFNGTITVDLSNVTKSGTFKVIDITGDAANNWNVEFVNAGYSSATYETVENDLVINVDYVAVDTDSVYVNSNWTAADANDKGLIALANGKQAVWGVNAFASVGEAMAAANGKPIAIDGGVYDSAIGLTELVITGDVTINDWSGVTSVIVKNGATITTNSWSNTVSLTIEAAGNNFSAPVINYIGSSSVSYDDVTVTGDDAVKSIVLGNKLYAGSDIIYNDPALAGKTAGDVVEFTVNGETFSGIYGTDVFSYSSKSALNGLSGANKVVILAGTYEPSVLGGSGFGAVGNVIYDGMQIPSADGTTGQALQVFVGTMTYDVHGVVQNTEVTSSSLNRFVMLAGATVHGNAVVDLKNLSSVTKTVQLSRGTSDVLGDFSLNVIGSTVNSAISDVQTLRVTGNIYLNVSNSTVGNVTLLSASASTASNLSVTIDNSTIGSLSGYNSKVEAASLTVKGISITGAISGFDYITISAGATLTATSITHNGTITIDVAGITESVKVIDGSANSTYGNIVLVNKGDAIVDVRVGDDNDVYLDVIRVITDTVYVNSNWSTESADANNLITLADGNKAAWGVNAFATVSEAAAAANGKPIAIDGGVYDSAIGLTDLIITGDVTINDWSGVDTITVKNGATITTNSWDGSDLLTVDLAGAASTAPVIDYTGSGEVVFGKVNFVNGNGAAYAVDGKLYAGSNVIYNNPSLNADSNLSEIVLGGVTFSGVYGESVFGYNDLNGVNSILGADKITILAGEYDSSIWSASGFNPAGKMTIFNGATIVCGGDLDTTNRIYLSRGDKGGSDIYGAVINSDVSKIHYFYAMYNTVNGGDYTIDIAGSTLNSFHLMRGVGNVANLTINVSDSTFTGGITDTGHVTISGELILNISGSSVTETINLMKSTNTSISKITVSITDSTVGNVYACSADKAGVSQDELILSGTVTAGSIDNFETVTITAGSVIDAYKLSADTINITLGEITEDICLIDTDIYLRYGTLNVTNPDALPAGFELIEFNGDLWAVNTSDPTKPIIGREITVGEVAVGDAFKNVTITNSICGAKADAGEVGEVAFSMDNVVAKSIIGGGSNANAAIDSININLNDTAFDTFYGGGYNAETGTIETELNGVRAKKMVYGGNVVNSNKSGNSTGSVVESVSLTITGGRFEGQVVGGGRVVASAGNTTVGDVCSVIGEVIFTVNADEKGFNAVFNDSVFGAGYVIGNHSTHRAELYVGKVEMVLDGMAMNSNGKAYQGIYAGGMASGNASITVGGVQTYAVVEADEAVYLSVVNGSYTSIFGGGWAEKGAKVIVNGVCIDVTGGDIENLYGGGNNDQSGARTYVDGDVFITISGGIIDNVYAGAKFVTSKVNGSSTVQITGSATIGNLCGLTSNGYDSVLEEQILDVDAAFSCKSISGFDVIDIAAGASITLVDSDKQTTLSFDFDGVDLVLGDYYGDTDWTVMTAEQLTNLAEASSVKFGAENATWNEAGYWATETHSLKVTEDNKLVFGKLA